MEKKLTFSVLSIPHQAFQAGAKWKRACQMYLAKFKNDSCFNILTQTHSSYNINVCQQSKPEGPLFLDTFFAF